MTTPDDVWKQQLVEGVTRAIAEGAGWKWMDGEPPHYRFYPPKEVRQKFAAQAEGAIDYALPLIRERDAQMAGTYEPDAYTHPGHHSIILQTCVSIAAAIRQGNPPSTDVATLRAALDQAEEALARLASALCFDYPRISTDEERMRMAYAEAALAIIRAAKELSCDKK